MRREVEDGKLLGFVCVGALTEGFDFPALKLGAYHVPHKTLGPTLQFIGRLSRAGEVPGELLAPRAAVTDETAALYERTSAGVSFCPNSWTPQSIERGTESLRQRDDCGGLARPSTPRIDTIPQCPQSISSRGRRT